MNSGQCFYSSMSLMRSLVYNGIINMLQEKKHLFHLPKASCVEWLTALQTCLQVLKIISEFLILSKLHNIIEVLHMLHHSIQLMEEA